MPIRSSWRWGIAPLCVVALLAAGCSDDTSGVNESIPLSLLASATPRSGEAPLQVDFQALTVGGVQPVTVVWDFGDDTTGSGTVASHSYGAAGDFDVTVTATDASAGTASQTFTIQVSAPPENQEPSLTATLDADTGVAPHLVHFEATVSGGDPPVTVLWEFGDGSVSTLLAPSYTYTLPGAYDAVVTATDVDGDAASAALSVTVGANDQPTARIRVDTNPATEGFALSFEGIAAGGDGALEFSWDFDDGSEGSTEQSPTHTFAAPGVYEVSFTATDEDGDAGVAFATITVETDALPIADLVLTLETPFAPLTVQGRCRVLAGNQPYRIAWDWGEGDAPTEGAETAEHTFATEGNYDVSCTVTDRDGQSDTDTQTVVSYPNDRPSIVVLVASPVIGPAPLEVELEAEVVSAIGAVSYLWELAEGVTSTDPSPVHVYAWPGTYEAALTVTDGEGATDTTTVDVIVTIPRDLVATILELTGTARDAQVELAISNIGTTSAGPTVARIGFEGDHGCLGGGGAETAVWLDVPPLGAGSTWVGSADFEQLPFGELAFTATADATGTVDEWDETNNDSDPADLTVTGALINEIGWSSLPSERDFLSASLCSAFPPARDGAPVLDGHIELIGSPDLDLTDWSLVVTAPPPEVGEPESRTYPLTGSLDDSGFFVLGFDGLVPEDGGLGEIGSVTLLDAADLERDVVGYGDWLGLLLSTDVPIDYPGEGAPPNVPQAINQAIGRDRCGGDTDDNSADFSILVSATPSMSNDPAYRAAGESCEDAPLLNPDGGQVVAFVEGDLRLASADIEALGELPDQTFRVVIPDGLVGSLVALHTGEDPVVEPNTIHLFSDCGADPIRSAELSPGHPVDLSEGTLLPGEYVVAVAGSWPWQSRVGLFFGDPGVPHSYRVRQAEIVGDELCVEVVDEAGGGAGGLFGKGVRVGAYVLEHATDTLPDRVWYAPYYQQAPDLSFTAQAGGGPTCMTWPAEAASVEGIERLALYLDPGLQTFTLPRAQACFEWPADDHLFVVDGADLVGPDYLVDLRVGEVDGFAPVTEVTGSLFNSSAYGYGYDDGYHMVFDSVGQRFFVTDHDNDLAIFDTSLLPPDPPPVFGAATDEPLGAAPLRTGRILVTDEEEYDGLYRLRADLSLHSGTSGEPFRWEGPEGVAYDSIHDRVFAANEDEAEIAFFDGRSLEHLDTFGACRGDGPYWLAVDGSSERLFSLNDDSCLDDGNFVYGIHVFDISGLPEDTRWDRYERSLHGTAEPSNDCYSTLTASESADRLYAIDVCSDTVDIYDTNTLELLGTVPIDLAGAQPLMVTVGHYRVPPAPL